MFFFKISFLFAFSKNFLPITKSERLSPVFYSKSFRVFDPFRLIFLYDDISMFILCTLVSSSCITFVGKIFTHWTASIYCRKPINHINVLYMDSLYGFIKGYIYALANTILSCYNFINNFEIFRKLVYMLHFCSFALTVLGSAFPGTCSISL